MAASLHSEIPIRCYPHHWDSISFYLGRHDVRSYRPDQLEQLLADLHRRRQTLLLVKSGPVLDDLLHALPDSLEFVSTGRPGWVTAGLIQRQSVPMSTHDP